MPEPKILSDTAQERRAELSHFIVRKSDYDRLVLCARELGESMAGEELTTSQLRNIYGMVKQMQAEGFDEKNVLKLKLLRPKLAYVAAKEPKLKKLARVLDDAIQLVADDPQLFERFADFFEAIVAYHSASAIAEKSKRSRRLG